MCPKAPIPPAVELDEFSTDETVIKFLIQLKNGHTLPSNILSEVDPYQVLPSNLPAGMWFFSSTSKRDTENGFWKSTGEACEIYKTSSITGMRKTLQYYEGQAHDGQKTNWIMQEYSTTDKFASKLDPRALYRVFMVDDSSSGGGHPFKSELKVKNDDDVAGPSDVANQSLDQLHDDYVSRGDFLELNDLANPLSCTTSFNSSCMTQSMNSEEYFDSDALMRELGDDFVDQDVQDSRVKLNLSTPAKVEHVVVQQTTTTIGSPENVNEPKPSTEQTSERNPIPESKSTLNEVNTAPPPPPQSVQPPQSASSPPSSPPPSSPPPSSPPPSSSAASSSNGSGGSSKEEKKDRPRRTKKRKMMKFLCFLAF